MNHNPQWDMCWLTLLTRARKHTDIRAFSWQALMPLLTLKTRELLALPVARGKSFQYKDFPFVFPRYIHSVHTHYEHILSMHILLIQAQYHYASYHYASIISI